jgi:hypothetical protein
MRGKEIGRERKTRNLKAETRKKRESQIREPSQSYKNKGLAKGSPILSAKPAERMGHPEAF